PPARHPFPTRRSSDLTGVEIVCDGTSCFGLPAGSGAQVTVIGGTSVACPMFSALWAVANEGAGAGGLGQAARLLYSLPAGAITEDRKSTRLNSSHVAI